MSSEYPHPPEPPAPVRYDIYGKPIRPAVVQHPTSGHTSGKAIASLVLGVVSILAGGPLLGLPAMLLSSGAKKEIAHARGAVGGSGLAAAGFWTGLVGSLLGLVGFFLVLAALGLTAGMSG